MTTLVGGNDDEDHPVRVMTSKEKAEITNTLVAWWDGDIPFFTKERLRTIHDQLQGLNGTSGTISIPDMKDGSTKGRVKSGNAIPDLDEDCERVLSVATWISGRMLLR